MQFTFNKTSWLPCAGWTGGLAVEAGIQGATVEVEAGLGGWTTAVAEERKEKNADVRSIWEIDGET